MPLPSVQWVIDPEAEDFLAIKKPVLENSEVNLSEITLYPTHSFLRASSDGKVIDNENKGLLEIQCSFSIKSCNISQYEVSEILELNDRQFYLEISSGGPTLRNSMQKYKEKWQSNDPRLYLLNRPQQKQIIYIH